jgi:PAS domain S-box-containing protein
MSASGQSVRPRKEPYERLLQERAWLTTIVEQMPGGLIIAEAPSGRVLTVNEHARRLLGIADGQTLHGIDRAFKLDGSRYAPDEFPLARALAGERVADERMEIGAPDGGRFFIDVRAAPVRDETGRITGAVSLLDDVTDKEARGRAEQDFVTNAATSSRARSRRSRAPSKCSRPARRRDPSAISSSLTSSASRAGWTG